MSTAASRVLRVGTRASALALWQTERVRALLAERGYATERVEITTTGDVIQDIPLAAVGGVAFFTRQLDETMLAGHIDLAVHSLKDLPTVLPPGIRLAAVSSREDPRDALVGRHPLLWRDVPPRAIIATSSLRRRAQLKRARPDLTVVDIRGNVDTRLARLDASPEWAATVLATAGLVRLGFAARIGERMPLDVMLPAPGQGALAVTARADDALVLAAAREAVHDEGTAVAVTAERALLRRLEGGCSVPIGALAEVRQAAKGWLLRLRGNAVSVDGTRAADVDAEGVVDDGDDATAFGEAAAETLLARGADRILHDLKTQRAAPWS
ncbi:MAG: hydroxymethylbilane synthase [Gemmatimonadota bacterium]